MYSSCILLINKSPSLYQSNINTTITIRAIPLYIEFGSISGADYHESCGRELYFFDNSRKFVIASQYILNTYSEIDYYISTLMEVFAKIESYNQTAINTMYTQLFEPLEPNMSYPVRVGSTPTCTINKPNIVVMVKSEFISYFKSQIEAQVFPLLYTIVNSMSPRHSTVNYPLWIQY